MVGKPEAIHFTGYPTSRRLATSLFTQLAGGDSDVAVWRLPACGRAQCESRPVGLQAYRLASHSRWRCAVAHSRTSEQHNTHRIEWREVRYAWHPWYGRAVAVYKRFARYDRVTFQCSIEADPEARHLEIPGWMFDPAICLGMQLAAVPKVSCEVLLELKSLLQSAPVPEVGVVLQAQHHSLHSPGGADAKVAEPQDHSIHTVSATTEESSLAGTASRSQSERDGASRATAALTLLNATRLQHQKAGRR